MNLTKQDLMVPCGRCGGKGKVASAEDLREYTCKSCQGRGIRLTETGEAIRALLLHLKKTGELE